MHKINTNKIVEITWASPKGKFVGAGKEVSEELGRKPQSTDLMDRHPFDVEILRVPPGKTPYPYHSHSAQWEFYRMNPSPNKITGPNAGGSGAFECCHGSAAELRRVNEFCSAATDDRALARPGWNNSVLGSVARLVLQREFPLPTSLASRRAGRLPVKQNNFKKRRFPLFCGSLVSRLRRSAREELFSDAEQKAERIVREELKKRGWEEPELGKRKKTDGQKAGIAQRLRRETVMTVAWIGQRLRMGSRHMVANCLKERWTIQ